MQYSEPILKMRALGEPEFGDPWFDYVTVYHLKPEHIPDLIQAAINPATWEIEADKPEVYTNVHAWRALGQMGAVEAIHPLIGILNWTDQYSDEWTTEELPIVFSMIGPAAIQPLAEAVASPEHGLFARVAAGVGLRKIAEAHPETRSECIAAIRTVLEDYQNNDETLNAFLITELATLREVETYPLVEKIYAEDKADLSIFGDWEDFQVEVGLLEDRITKLRRVKKADPETVTIDDVMDTDYFPVESMFPEVSKLESARKKKEKNKQKQEKQSRKKNRKKKK